MLIFSVWPELVKLPNLHLIRPNTLFLLWACTSGRQREKRAMAPTPTPPPFPIPPHFVLWRDREATRRAAARVCQAVTLAAVVVVKSAGSARPPTPPAPATILHFFVDNKVRQQHLFSPILVAPPEALAVPALNKSTPAPSGTTS